MSRNTASARFVRASVAVCIAAAAFAGLSSQAIAAEQEEETDEELTEVIVTGTRIQSPNVTSANPITSITAEEMRALGFVNVADALTQLVPQNISTYQPTMVGDDQSGIGGAGMESVDRGSFFIGNTIANLRGLDPAYGSRTLTLIDGRRVVSTSNQADVVDLNIIPSNLLQRMDVVTGGASATYGSGAMAGVVNLVLDNRRRGINLDVDYGVNEAGDGGSPHISLSGGWALGGKAHILASVEWQKTSAIRDCAAARDWCAESRTMFNNNSAFLPNVETTFEAQPGFEGLPARFQMENVRYSQFAPTGTIYHNSSNITSGWRFSEPDPNTGLIGIQEYAYGFRGGASTQAINGDGPLVTSGTAMRPSNERKVFFTNFEYDFTERTTGYVQANFARTDSLNKNRYTTGTYCVRFDQGGVTGTNTLAGGEWVFGSAVGLTRVDTGEDYAPARSTQLNGTLGTEVLNFLGLANAYADPSMNANGAVPAGTTSYISGGLNPYTNVRRPGIAWPFWVPVDLSPMPPQVDFNGSVGTWVKVRFNTFVPDGNATPGDATGPNGAFNYYVQDFNNEFWVLDRITLANTYDQGQWEALPSVNAEGRSNAYAFLNQLTPEAVAQLQRAWDNSPTTGAASGGNSLWGSNPCDNFTAIRKVWNPQFNRWTTQQQETMRVTAGVRGRFGRDWRWDVYYQYGDNNSTSRQNNVATNLRLNFALDAVIDDRVGSDTFGQPVCRVTRDGPPILDTVGRPLSNPDELAALAADCKPLNIFGTTFATPEQALVQQQAIDYAFVESESTGGSSLQQLSLSTNGTLWQGFGSGPLTSAFGIEVRENETDNKGTSTRGGFYERADLASVWQDAAGGKTRVTEAFTELNLPVISGQEGLNLLSVNAGVRWAQYYNKGGAGTTRQSRTQDITNWKFQTVFEPFDWVRARLSRSRDLRTAGYRDLFNNRIRIPDANEITNRWRDRTAYSTEMQSERAGTNDVGNINLKPETSDTLTVGLVISPGAWAQGMRFSADYYNIRVRDGIGVSAATGQRAYDACWEQSGNVAPTFDPDSGEMLDPGTSELDLIDDSLEACQALHFAELLDEQGNPIPGTRNLHDIVSFDNNKPENLLPYQRRGLDLSWSYVFPLNRAFESLPGTLSLNARASRALEASGTQLISCSTRGGNPDLCFGPSFNRFVTVDLVGQIRSSTFIAGVQPQPKWSGNFSTSYRLGSLTTSLSFRYTGGAKLDKTWCDSPDCPNYQNELGQYLGGSVDDNQVEPYFLFSLNGSYDLRIANMRQFQIFGSINNLFDKDPPFTGGGVSGASAQYHDTMGRAYRFGARIRF